MISRYYSPPPADDADRDTNAGLQSFMTRNQEHLVGSYSENSFWRKLQQYARKAGRHVVEKALWLWYTAKEPGTPKWAKRSIYAALGYFILPLDLIPDVVPGVGFTDDLSALALAVAAVAIYITPNVKRRAAEKVARWFGDTASEPAT